MNWKIALGIAVILWLMSKESEASSGSSSMVDDCECDTYGSKANLMAGGLTL